MADKDDDILVEFGLEMDGIEEGVSRFENLSEAGVTSAIGIEYLSQALGRLEEIVSALNIADTEGQLKNLTQRAKDLSKVVESVGENLVKLDGGNRFFPDNSNNLPVYTHIIKNRTDSELSEEMHNKEWEDAVRHVYKTNPYYIPVKDFLGKDFHKQVLKEDLSLGEDFKYLLNNKDFLKVKGEAVFQKGALSLQEKVLKEYLHEIIANTHFFPLKYNYNYPSKLNSRLINYETFKSEKKDEYSSNEEFDKAYAGYVSQDLLKTKEQTAKLHSFFDNKKTRELIELYTELSTRELVSENPELYSHLIPSLSSKNKSSVSQSSDKEEYDSIDALLNQMAKNLKEGRSVEESNLASMSIPIQQEVKSAKEVSSALVEDIKTEEGIIEDSLKEEQTAINELKKQEKKESIEEITPLLTEELHEAIEKENQITSNELNKIPDQPVLSEEQFEAFLVEREAEEAAKKASIELEEHAKEITDTTSELTEDVKTEEDIINDIIQKEQEEVEKLKNSNSHENNVAVSMNDLSNSMDSKESVATPPLQTATGGGGDFIPPKNFKNTALSGDISNESENFFNKDVFRLFLDVMNRNTEATNRNSNSLDKFYKEKNGVLEESQKTGSQPSALKDTIEKLNQTLEKSNTEINKLTDTLTLYTLGQSTRQVGDYERMIINKENQKIANDYYGARSRKMDSQTAMRDSDKYARNMEARTKRIELENEYNDSFIGRAARETRVGSVIDRRLDELRVRNYNPYFYRDKELARQRNLQLRNEKLAMDISLDRRNYHFGETPGFMGRIKDSVKEGLYNSSQNAMNRRGFRGTFARMGGNLFRNTAFGKAFETLRRDSEGNVIKDAKGKPITSSINLGILTFAGIAAGFSKLTKSIMSLAKESVTAYGNIEKLKTGLAVAFGNNTQSSDVFNQIADYSVKSPFGTQTVTEFATLLKQSGVYVSDLMEVLKQIGDTAGGNQEKFSRIANNYAQIIAANKATSMDLRQFANAGLPIYKVLREQLNVDQQTLRSMTQRGEISSEVIEKAFEKMTSKGGVFYQSVEEGAKTYAARVQNFSDVKELNLSNAGRWIFEASSMLLSDGKTSSIFQEVLTVLENIYKKVGDITENLNQKRAIELFNQTKEDIDSYENLIQMAEKRGDTTSVNLFKDLLDKYKSNAGYTEDTDRSIRATRYEKSINKVNEDIENYKYREALGKYKETVFRKTEMDGVAETRAEFDLAEMLTSIRGMDKHARNMIRNDTPLGIFSLSREQEQDFEKAKRKYSSQIKYSTGMDVSSMSWGDFQDFVNNFVSKREGEKNLKGLFLSLEKRFESSDSLQELNNRKYEIETGYDRDAYRQKQAIAIGQISWDSFNKSYERNENSVQKLTGSLEELFKKTEEGQRVEEEKRQKEFEYIKQLALVQKNLNLSDSKDWSWIKEARNTDGLYKDVLKDSSLASVFGLMNQTYNTGEQLRLIPENLVSNENGKESDELKILKQNMKMVEEFKRNFKAEFTDPKYEGVLSRYNAIESNIYSLSANPNDKEMAKRLSGNIGDFYNYIKETGFDSGDTVIQVFLRAFTESVYNGIDDSKISAIENDASKKFVAFWKRLASSTLGLSLDVIKNVKSETVVGNLYKNSMQRDSVKAISTAMLREDSAESVFRNRIEYSNGKTQGESKVLDWDKTSENYKTYALSSDSSIAVTNAYATSLDSQINKLIELFSSATTQFEEGQYLDSTKESLMGAAKALGYTGDNAVEMEKEISALDLSFDSKNPAKFKENLAKIVSELLNAAKESKRVADNLGILKTALSDLTSEASQSVQDYNFTEKMSGKSSREIEVEQRFEKIVKEYKISSSEEDTKNFHKKLSEQNKYLSDLYDGYLLAEDKNSYLTDLEKEYGLSSNSFKTAFKDFSEYHKNTEQNLNKADKYRRYKNQFNLFKSPVSRYGEISTQKTENFFNWVVSDGSLFTDIMGNTAAQRNFLEKSEENSDETSFKGYIEESYRDKTDKAQNVLREQRYEDFRNSSYGTKKERESLITAAKEGIANDNTAGLERIIELTEKATEADKKYQETLDNLATSMKDTFKSSLLNGFNKSLEVMGESLATGADAGENLAKAWRNIASEMLGSIGSAMAQAGFNIAAQAAVDHQWGRVQAGLALAAASGVAAFTSGLLTDSSSSDKDNGETEKLQNLKDALSDLIDQAKTDAEYYQKNYLHKNAISENMAISKRSVNDAIITPSGNIVTTHPDDYLIATKTPETLMSGRKGEAPIVTVTIVNESGDTVKIQKTEKKEDSYGNIDIKATIVAVTAEAIANGDMDDAFIAMNYRQTGRSVTN